VAPLAAVAPSGYGGDDSSLGDVIRSPEGSEVVADLTRLSPPRGRAKLGPHSPQSALLIPVREKRAATNKEIRFYAKWQILFSEECAYWRL
jgi:hypothetical protein